MINLYVQVRPEGRVVTQGSHSQSYLGGENHLKSVDGPIKRGESKIREKSDCTARKKNQGVVWSSEKMERRNWRWGDVKSPRLAWRTPGNISGRRNQACLHGCAGKRQAGLGGAQTTKKE